MSHFVISGSGEGGNVANRLEINDLVKNEKLFSLYIQALADMSARSQDDPTSFFQVGGIHGLPFAPWDGDDNDNDDQVGNNQWGGYCTHGSVLFPTWHRPYVLLYEQILNMAARQIAQKYSTDQDSWIQAAASLRQPYWDWARNAVPPPEVISLQQVTITTPNGRKAVDNPLIRYKFHPIDQSFPDPYDQWRTTLRQPNSTGPNAKDNVTRLTNILRSAQRDLTSKTYNLLTRVRTWPAFSNHSPGDGGSTSNSLEAIHDGIHVNVGGNGQMSDPSVAAFDPIFFLHHANVDRILSLWAALHPGVWVTPGDQDDGTFTLPVGGAVDATTPLTPFWNAQTTFWASSAVTSTVPLGYSYPEFNGLDMGNPSAVQSAIAVIVNKLYGGGSFGSFPIPRSSSFLAEPARLPTAVGAPPAKAASQSASVPIPAITRSSDTESTQPVEQANPSNPPTVAATTSSRSLPSESAGNPDSHVSAFIAKALVTLHPQNPTPPTGNMWDWSAKIHFKKYELGSSFSVLIFLGQVPEDPEEWVTSPNYVGAHYAFVNRSAARCANCTNQIDIIDEGFVHLNPAIAEHSGLGSFEPEVVHPYLEKELHWRVQKVDGNVVQLESLEVTVISTPLSMPPGAQFPVGGEPIRHPRITHGRRGGARHL